MTPSFGIVKIVLSGFNPCFGGSYIVTAPLAKKGVCYEQFQSLFWWILYCDTKRKSRVWWKGYGFNPCFGGSYIVTAPHIFWRLPHNGFNPCFGGSYIVTYGTKKR